MRLKLSPNGNLYIRDGRLLFGPEGECCCNSPTSCDWNLVRNCDTKSVEFSPVLTGVNDLNDLSERWDHPAIVLPGERTHLTDGLWELVERELSGIPFYSPPVRRLTDAFHCFSVDLQSDTQMTFSVTFFGDNVELDTGDPWDGGNDGPFNAIYSAFVFTPFLSCAFSMGETDNGQPSNRITATISINETNPGNVIPVFPFASNRNQITFPAAERTIDISGTVNIGPLIELLIDNDGVCRERRMIDYSITMTGDATTQTLTDSQIVDITEQQAQEFINTSVNAGVDARGASTIPPQVKARLTDLLVQVS